MNSYCEFDCTNFKGLSKGLCCSALYSAFPYVFSFSQNAWFKWEKDKNAVTVLCPAGCIAMQVRKLENKKVLVKVKEIFCGCVKEHTQGEQFEFSIDSSGLKELNAFSSGFPLEFAGNGKNACKANSRLKSKASVKVAGFDRTCRYHKKKGQTYSFEQLMPQGFCVFAFNALYPSALSLLYDGKNSEKRASCVVSCLGDGKNKVAVELRTVPKKMQALYDFAEKIFRVLGIPQDIIDKNVVIKVLEVQGKCTTGLKKGMEFKFNVSNTREMCPASLYTIAPVLLNCNGSAGKSKRTAFCPSIDCKVKYEVN